MLNETMFCPKCGNAEQLPETYCRQCGTFLPDFDKPVKKPVTPQEHLKINSIFSMMTAIVSLTLAILLYYFFLGKEDTPIIIYITGGFLTAMCGWQIQTFWRTLLVKKHLKKQPIAREVETKMADSNSLYVKPAQTNKLLDEADLSNFVPPIVVEDTTKHLKEKIVK